MYIDKSTQHTIMKTFMPKNADKQPMIMETVEILSIIIFLSWLYLLPNQLTNFCNKKSDKKNVNTHPHIKKPNLYVLYQTILFVPISYNIKISIIIYS